MRSTEELMTVLTLRKLALTLSLPLALAAAVGGLAVPAAAEISPVPLPVTVTPSTGLAGGDSVTVTATGLPPDTAVRVNQCDRFDFEEFCRDVTTVTSDAAGQVVATVTLADPVFRVEPFGDDVPVYCRADVCRLFLVWTDTAGSTQAAASDPMEFSGSPATIDASPTSGLHRVQRVRVHGTAVGAEGRTVVVVEEACFAIVQGSGCYGTLVKGSGTVAPDGTYAMPVRVTRYLADGTDCADPLLLGSCQLTARILDASGQPDDSFGVSRIGDPGVRLTFRG